MTDGPLVSLPRFVVVSDAPLTAAGVQAAATEGALFSGVVASFSDANPLAELGEFSATVTWGDGGTSAGVVAADGHGGFVVTGSHTFLQEGSYAVSVQVNDVGGSVASAAYGAARSA